MAGKAKDPGHGQYSVLDMIDRLLTTKSVTRTESAINEPTLEWPAQTKTMESTCVNHTSIDDRQSPKRLSPDLCRLNRRIEKIDSTDGKAITDMHEHINKLFGDQDLPQPRFDGPCQHASQLRAAVYDLERARARHNQQAV